MTTKAIPIDYTSMDVPVLWGRGLRFVLLNELMDHPETTVAHLVTTIAEQGYELGGRASKVISDALRWEVRRGRVVRLGRGRYRYRGAPRSTARRVRVFAARCLAWIVATTRGERPPPTPPDPRAQPWKRWSSPEQAPWAQLGWLWVM